ncbi:hypothetical protein GQX73_g7259 [Xylaria multiplex]|uniref:Apple domain-containing protein n=1 Tax=Xylaria multiplex TaxID=323545 RepID=A0A7C8MPK6_9PEZI|nr:hypothetical protein GQX73_g7259 [Xylaria multiplex]
MSYIGGNEKFTVNPTEPYSTAPEVIIPPIVLREQYTPQPQYVVETQTPKSGLIWGSRLRDMKLSTCIIIAVVIGLVVIGASVGGAIGGTAALRSKSNESSMPESQDATATSLRMSPTVTSSTLMTISTSQGHTSSSTSQPTPAPSTPTFSTDCPSSNRTTYTSRFSKGGDGPTTPEMGLTFEKLCSVDHQAVHIAQVTVASFDLCIEVCASFNFWANNAACTSVAYAVGNGACWVSNSTISTRLNNGISGAVLIPNE